MKFDRTESVVLDLMEVRPQVILDLIRSLPMWTLGTSQQYDRTALVEGHAHWHLSHAPVMIQGRSLAPAGYGPRQAITPTIDRPEYRSWRNVWSVLTWLFDRPELELLQVRLTATPYGADACSHVDSTAPDEVTILVSANIEWDLNWGGETVLFNEDGEVIRTVIPKPGRAFVYRSAARHSVRPLARSCPALRYMLVMQCASWPENEPIAARVPDAIEESQRRRRQVGEPEAATDLRALSEPCRVAAAVQWINQSEAGRMAYGKGTLAGHLGAMAAWLSAMDADPEVILAGLYAGATQPNEAGRSLIDPRGEETRAIELFGHEEVRLGRQFAQCERNALRAVRDAIARGATLTFPFPLERDPRMVRRWEDGSPLRVGEVDLSALCLLDIADEVARQPNPAVIGRMMEERLQLLKEGMPTK